MGRVFGFAVAGAIVLSATSSWAQVMAGGEFRVPTYTLTFQHFPHLAVDKDGDFVVAWDSYQQDGSNQGVFAQRYDSAGRTRGAEFRVNTYTTSYQRLDPQRKAVAAGPDGRFVVAWTTDGQDGSPGAAVFAQRYDSLGTRIGGEFQVNTYTTSYQYGPSVALAHSGNFVVVWNGYLQDGSSWGIFGQRFDAAANRLGGEFQVNGYTTFWQEYPRVASDAAGNFVVAWHERSPRRAVFLERFDSMGNRLGSELQVNTYTSSYPLLYGVAMAPDGRFVVSWASFVGGPARAAFVRRFDAAGDPLGAEFIANASTTVNLTMVDVAIDWNGSFVVTWTGSDGDSLGVFARRFDSAGNARGPEFPVSTYTALSQMGSTVSSDEVGNFVIAWEDQDPFLGIVGQRYGGLVPAALALDTAASGGSDGNRVLEPGETVDVRPSWRNLNGTAQTFAGALSSITGPSGPTYTITDAAAGYGTAANGSTAPCTDCYAVSVSNPPARPATHWDASALESILPDTQGQRKTWRLHVGGSFTDVPAGNAFYGFVETLLHFGVTGGCTATTYCPSQASTRDQMAVFVLVAKESASYTPPACTTPMFNDVPAGNPFCRWIEELARRGVVSGCGGGRYCPGDPVTREQMAVFVLRTLDPALNPPACSPPNLFADVPETSPFCRWIEELARRGVVSGCGGGNYCPTASVTREQMAVFISGTFGLTLYGP